MRSRLFSLLKILVSAGLLIYLLVFRVDLRELWDLLAQAAWGDLAAAAGLMIAGTALRAVRWQALLDALDIHVPLRRLAALYFIGAFFNIFMPSGLGGDAVKMVELGRGTGRAPEAVGTTLVDRAMGLWVLFIMALLALPFSHQLLPDGWLLPIAAISAAGVLGGWLVMGTPVIPWLGGRVRLPGQAKLERFYASVSRLGYRALGKAALVSLVFNLLLVLFNLLIARGLGVRQPPGIFFLFTPIISLSLALPISVGGLGVREETYARLFGGLGVPAATAVGMGLANYLLTNLVVGLIGGLIYLAEGARGLGIRSN